MMKGKLEFFSETGTEGGLWAFFDTSHERKDTSEWGIWSGSDVWDPADPERHGKTVGCWHQDGRVLPDPINSDPDYFLSSLYQGQQGDRQADARLAARYGFTLTYADDWSTPKVEPRRPYGVGRGDLTVCGVRWDDESPEAPPNMCLSNELLVIRRDYEGLHILKDGDRLSVFGADGSTAWEGEIKLKQHGLFTEDAFGMWIHADQEGMSREQWATMFFEEWPAELEVADG